jgi:hypothetical protein
MTIFQGLEIRTLSTTFTNTQPPHWAVHLDDALKASLGDRKLDNNLRDNNAPPASGSHRPVENQNVEKSITSRHILQQQPISIAPGAKLPGVTILRFRVLERGSRLYKIPIIMQSNAGKWLGILRIRLSRNGFTSSALILAINPQAADIILYADPMIHHTVQSLPRAEWLLPELCKQDWP